MVMERCTQKVIGSYDEAVAIEKEFEALETKMGNVPTKRRYYAMYSGLLNSTYVWERDWESLAALEAYSIKTMNDPEWAAVIAKAAKIFADSHFEIFGVLVI
jgi:hypothetical protein